MWSARARDHYLYFSNPTHLGLLVARWAWFDRITTAAPESKLSVYVFVQQLGGGGSEAMFYFCTILIRIVGVLNRKG